MHSVEVKNEGLVEYLMCETFRYKFDYNRNEEVYSSIFQKKAGLFLNYDQFYIEILEEASGALLKDNKGMNESEETEFASEVRGLNSSQTIVKNGKKSSIKMVSKRQNIKTPNDTTLRTSKFEPEQFDDAFSIQLQLKMKDLNLKHDPTQKNNSNKLLIKDILTQINEKLSSSPENDLTESSEAMIFSKHEIFTEFCNILFLDSIQELINNIDKNHEEECRKETKTNDFQVVEKSSDLFKSPEAILFKRVFKNFQCNN